MDAMSSVVKAVKLLLLAAWVGLAPVHPAVITALCLPLVDLTLALISARRAGEAITSAGLKRSVAKVLMYELAIVLAFVTEQYLLSSLVPAVRVVTGLIGMTELKSCLEHLDTLGGQPLFASILKRLAPPQPNQSSTDNEIQS
jgi:hypothetical protein